MMTRTNAKLTKGRGPHIPTYAKCNRGDKDDHRWAIHRGVIQIPQEVISKVVEQRLQNPPHEVETNGHGHIFLGRRH